MPIKTYCMNCYRDKEPERILEYLCGGCFSRGNEAEEHATREGGDPAAARRSALASQVAHPMSGKLPNVYFPRVGGMQ